MNGIEFESEILERLGFCGCGLPDEALELIHDLMLYIEEFRSSPYEGPYEGPIWDDPCKADKEALKKVIDNNYDGVCYTLFYLLDNKNITTHGGSVPGWLEDYEFLIN